MRLTFLGTASGSPTKERNVTSVALRFDNGDVWLFDCGEGTQHQILHTDLRPGRIRRIFISHLHGDHCYGLPGILAAIAVHDCQYSEIEVVGPLGLGEWVQTTLRVSDMHVPYKLRISELQGAQDLGIDQGMRVQAVPLVHRVPSFAYVMTENQRRGRFDAQAALTAGVAWGPAMGELARGESVLLSDGREIRGNDFLGPPRPGRSLVVCGDSSDSSALVDVISAPDVLVHECTFDASRQVQAREWGHSTSYMVGDLAAQLQVKQLLVSHFSARYHQNAEFGIPQLVEEIQSRCPQTQVWPAHDFMHFELPTVDVDQLGQD